MFNYVLRKLLLAIPLLLCIITLVFVLLELSPGDAASKYLSPEMPPEVRELVIKKHGLDKPAHIRYVRMMSNVVMFDFGRSLNEDRPVFDIVRESLPNTLLLSMTTLVVLFPVGIGLGTIQAVRQNTALDAAASVGSLTVYSAPAFWVALMLQLIFGLYLADVLPLPISGMKDPVMYDFMGPWEQFVDRVSHLILPGVAMGVAAAASTARYMRSSMLGIIRQDFVRTARAKGLTEWQVVLRHGVRNALLPIVTLMGLSLPFLFSGSILVEIVFGWPGMGRLIYQSILTQDTPVLIACFTIYTLVVVSGNLLADIAYSFVDPRIRLG